MDEQSYQAKVRNTAIPAVYLILESRKEKGRILLALRQNTGYQDGMWEVPAGHVDEGELPTDAMIRETREEIGITLRRNELVHVHTSYRPVHDRTGNRVDLVFRVSQVDPTPVIMEPEKCAAHQWFLPTNLPRNTIPHVAQFIELWWNRKPYSEFDVEWLKEKGLYKL